MRPVTLRLSLATSLLLLVLLLSASILVVTVRASRRIADDLSARYLAETERSVEERMRAFFAPVRETIEAARTWSRKGVIDPHDLDASTSVFLPFLRAHPQVSSIATGDEGGYSYRLGAEGDGWLERVVTAGDPTAPARFRVLDARAEVQRVYEEANTFDPRTRPWYADARRALAEAGSAARAEVVWSEPFLLNTSRMPGIAATAPFEDATGGVYMVTFNVMLERLSEFTAALRPTPNGRAMVLSRAGEVVGFPASERFATREARVALVAALNAQPAAGRAAGRAAGAKAEERLPRLTQLGEPLLSEVQPAFAEAVAAGGPAARVLEAEGGPWRAAFRPFDLGPGVRLWTAVLVPEDDFLAEVRAQQRQILWVAGAALLLAAGLALRLAKAYARPLRHLAAESDRITALDLAPGAPVRTHLLEVQRLAEAQERMRGALDSFARYVPTEVVRELVRQGAAARLGGQVQPLTVMFSDIRGFTTLSETLAPEALTAHLAAYFQHLMEAVAAHGGSVDKMIGDAVMSLWGAPVRHADHAARAVRAALAMRDWLAGFNARCEREGLPPLRTGFGIATGDAFVGNVGAPSRLNYTALGDMVNLASRLEGASKVYGADVLVAEPVKAAAGAGFVWRLLDVLAVKGKQQGVRVYEPLGTVEALAPGSADWLDGWHAAFEDYLARRFDAAEGRLAVLERARPHDLAVRRLLDACRRFRAEPPPPGWDGVARLDAK